MDPLLKFNEGSKRLLPLLRYLVRSKMLPVGLQALAAGDRRAQALRLRARDAQLVEHLPEIASGPQSQPTPTARLSQNTAGRPIGECYKWCACLHVIVPTCVSAWQAAAPSLRLGQASPTNQQPFAGLLHSCAGLLASIQPSRNGDKLTVGLSWLASPLEPVLA